MLSVSSFRQQAWVPALDRKNLANGPMKTLRAFAASLWLDAGGSIEFVPDQHGHADLRTTQKYLETFSSRRESIMSRLDDRLESRSDVGWRGVGPLRYPPAPDPRPRKKPPANRGLLSAPGVGLEPTTYGLTVRRSAN